MKINKKKFKQEIDFQIYLNKQLRDPVIKKYYDEFGKQLEVAYAILQLRKKFKLSQLELAKRIGTTQSNIARMESGQQNFTVELLQRIARAYERDLKIEFV